MANVKNNYKKMEKMSRLQALNLAIFFSLCLALYSFIFAKYHYKFTWYFGFFGLILAGAIIFFILIFWSNDERE